MCINPEYVNSGKWGFQEEIFDKVDWYANEKALRSTLILRQHWLSKQLSGMCGVEKMMKIWGNW